MVIRRFAYLGVVMLVAALPVTALAYTPEQQQACTSDAFRVCGSDIPDVDRVTACMMRNKAQLSPPCRAQFGPEPVSEETVATRADRPVNIRPRSSKRSAKAHKTRKPAAE